MPTRGQDVSGSSCRTYGRLLQVLAVWSWLVLAGAEAGGASGLLVEPFSASPPTYNELGFDVSYEVESFPDLDATLRNCQEGMAGSAKCDVRATCTIGGYDFLSLAGRWSDDGHPMMSTELLAREAATGQVRSLFQVAIEAEFGAVGHLEYFSSPAGPLLRVPVRLSGTGAFNRHFHFLWRDGAWREIDAQGWLKAVSLPPDHGIWKGVEVDPRTFTAHTSVWREGDGNCCPSGGEVDVRLVLNGRKLEIESQSYRPERGQ
jgi:hypothetical protein